MRVMESRIELPIETRDAPKCSYLNDKKLSEEHCYILNRAKQERFVGNSLQKPSLLMKPICLRDTNVEEEHLEAGKNFGKKNNESNPSDTCDKKKNKKKKGDRQNESIPECRFSNKFLKHPCTITANIHERVVKFVVAKHHSHCRVILSSPFIYLEANFGLQRNPLPTKDMRNRIASQDSDTTGLGYVREIHPLLAGESLTLPPGTEWTVIDGRKLFEYSQQKERRYSSDELSYEW